MLLDEIEKKLKTATTPEDVFGQNIDAGFKNLRILTHPDHNLDRPQYAQQLFSEIYRWYQKAVSPPPVISLKSPLQTYSLNRIMAVGDVADIYEATASSDYLVKVSRVPHGNLLLENESKILKELFEAKGRYHVYLPSLIESFKIRDKIQKQATVFLHEPGHYTVDEVLSKHKDGLDGRHIGWIFNRMMSVMGFIHHNGYVHGSIIPSHILLQAEFHGLKLIGWGQSVKIGQPIKSISTAYKDWYPPEVFQKKPSTPATDIYLAVKSIIHIAGGNALKNQFPDTIPVQMQRFFKSCLLDSPTMRPQDAWELSDRFNERLTEIYGPKKFHILNMS